MALEVPYVTSYLTEHFADEAFGTLAGYEALYERGYGNHGNGLYDDEVAIPLAARLPGVEPACG